MTDISEVGDEEFENAVEMMMEKDKFKDCLDYIETKIDQHVVLNNMYLFDIKLNCLYELDRKMDAFVEAKAYRDDYRPLTHTVCVALGNGYMEEGDYIKAYFYFKQFPSKDSKQSPALLQLATKIEKEIKRKLCEEKYEECLDDINKIDEDAVFSNVEIFDCKLKCLMKLDQKKKAIQEAQAFLGSGGVLSYFGCEILGSSYASKGNYDEARKHYLRAINLCSTREEKIRYCSLLNNMEKEEERRRVRKEDKRVAKIDPSFLKGEIKRDDKKFTMSSKKKKKGAVKEFEGDSNKEEHVEAIIGKLEGDLFGESDKPKEARIIKEIGVTNQQFSTTVRFSVELYHNGIFNVIKEDHFNKSSMSLVKATKHHLENLDLLKSWGYDLPYMARVESALPSDSISPDHLLVVERIQPLHDFFTTKKEEFLKKHPRSVSKESDWWEYIRKSFRLIFRDIICGLFFLHSSNRVCADFNDSLYVNKEGRGRILHNFAKDFSYAQAREDVKDIARLIEFVITGSTCQLVNRKDLKSHFDVIKDMFNLPHELSHFLVLLNTKHDYIAQRKLSSSWLIDHPYFWDDEHCISFMKLIKDMTRLNWISEFAFDHLPDIGLTETWSRDIKNDLLREIWHYKNTTYRTASSIVFYFCAVYAHINDLSYQSFRGSKKLSDIEIELLLRNNFPEVYNCLFEALCVLQVQDPIRYTNVVKKLSSCCGLKIDRMCLKESR